jgi:hypothetical protein
MGPRVRLSLAGVAGPLGWNAALRSYTL